MPTATAKFNGYGHRPGKPRDFSTSLRAKLLALHVPDFKGTAEEFADGLISTARVACEDLFWHAFEVTKPEAIAEVNSLNNVLGDAVKKLRTISPTVGRSLAQEADPLSCADTIEALLAFTQSINPSQLPSGVRRSSMESAALKEMTARVITFLDGYEVSSAIASSKLLGEPSLLIVILKTISGDLRLIREDITWRDIITKANATRIQS